MHWFNIIIVVCRILSQIHVPQLPDTHEVKKKENPNKQPGCDSHMTLIPCHFEWVPGEKGPKRVYKEKASGMFWDVPYLLFLSMTAQDGRLGRKRRAGKMRTKRWKKHEKACKPLCPVHWRYRGIQSPYAICSEINDDWSRYSLHLKHPVVPEDVTFTISATIL